MLRASKGKNYLKNFKAIDVQHTHRFSSSSNFYLKRKFHILSVSYSLFLKSVVPRHLQIWETIKFIVVLSVENGLTRIESLILPTNHVNNLA